MLLFAVFYFLDKLHKNCAKLVTCDAEYCANVVLLHTKIMRKSCKKNICAK